MPDGNIRSEHVKVLKEMGEWMDKYGETIYGTRGGPFEPKPWGVSTQKDNKIYIHLLDWTDPALVLPKVPQKIKKARVFGSGEKVSIDQNKERIILEFPAKHPSVVDMVIELEY